MESKQPHIMVLPFPAQGHMSPVVQFAKRLASNNVLITLIADEKTVATSNFMLSETSSLQIEYISNSVDELDKLDKSDNNQFLADHKLRVQRQLPYLIKKQENSGYPVQVLVYDSHMTWALDIAKELGLKGASFFTQSCAVCAIYYHMHKGTLDIPKDETSLVSIPSLPISMDPRDLPSFIYDMGSYPSFLALVVGQLSNVDKADWILFNNFEALEDEGMDYTILGESSVLT